MFWYLSSRYIKNFFIIYTALILFYVGFDYMQGAKYLPASANLRMLYVYYQTLFSSDILFGVSLAIAMITTKLGLIRSNELVAIYAIGYSKKQILMPFFVVSMLFTFVNIALHNSNYAYAEEYVRSIADKGTLSRATRDLFFKHNNYYVYFERLYPALSKAEGIKVFRKNDGEIIEVIRAKEGFYHDRLWSLPKATIMRKELQLEFTNTPISIHEQENIEILQGFRPDILNHIYEGKVHYSIEDVIVALMLLNEQKIDNAKVVSSLLTMVVYPLFAPALVVLFFGFFPLSSRNSKVALNAFVMVIVTLFTWGVLFTLTRVTHSGSFTPFWGIVFPVLLLWSASLWAWFAKKVT